MWPPKEPGTTIEDRMCQTTKHIFPITVAILTSYSITLKRPTGMEISGMVSSRTWSNCGTRAILFCSYGSPSSQPVEHDNGSLLVIPNNARVSLTPYHDGTTSDSYFPPISLLFSREEFDEAVDRFRGPDNMIENFDRCYLNGHRDMRALWGIC